MSISSTSCEDLSPLCKHKGHCKNRRRSSPSILPSYGDNFLGQECSAGKSEQALVPDRTGMTWGELTNEPQLRELQDHPLFRGLLQGKVLHRAEIVWLGHNVILQLQDKKAQCQCPIQVPATSLYAEQSHHRPEESFGTDPVYSGRCSKHFFFHSV